MQARIQALEAQVQEREQQISTLDERLAAAEARIADGGAALKSTKARLRECESSLRDREGALQSAEGRCHAFEEANVALKLQVSGLPVLYRALRLFASAWAGSGPQSAASSLVCYCRQWTPTMAWTRAMCVYER